MEGLISIKESEFCEEFKSIDLENTFLASQKEAEEIWRKYIDKKFQPYHQIDKYHWLNSTVYLDIGSWIESYNEDDYSTVEFILESELTWDNDDTILFCMSRYFIIRSIWSEFKKGWINFLMCEDENPVLINECNQENILIFTPIGRIRKVNRGGNGTD